ncbi:MAG: MarR family transcriptional regulator [Phenylobacterium sp.]|uniref:MarR family winged helix-turn-helix transcriptional regulator n=1 Tax=Phenylobacterium sp. TaxID=1871053 RepID=UPI001A43023B|nr:MarR family transcriptional regulator [Phenylobacterium sp.]MBL8771554.1 MarR family transcriptional regulator [Phenylobacterium sp.]
MNDRPERQPPATRADLLMTRLLMRVYWFDEALQTALKSAGWPPVTRGQSLLFANVSAGVHRPTRLAENLGVTRQYMSQMIGELAARGLLEVGPDPEDRRAQVVTFGKAAIPLRDAAFKVLQDLEAELDARIGADAVEALGRALAADWGPPPQVAAPPIR